MSDDVISLLEFLVFLAIFVPVLCWASAQAGREHGRRKALQIQALIREELDK